MKITPQDIIDKEFKVKFRGFDMAEVDAFLEEVAENFFKLTEENTLLNEKVLALQSELEAAGSLPGSGPAEFPEEFKDLLEDLKQDTAAIGAELASLKQERLNFDSLEKNLKAAVAAIQEAAGETKLQEMPAELSGILEDYKKDAETLRAELDSLNKNLEEAVTSLKEAASQPAQQSMAKVPADLVETLTQFNKKSAAFGTEFADIKAELESLKKSVTGAADQAAGDSSGSPLQVSEALSEGLDKRLEEISKATLSFASEIGDLKNELGSIAQLRDDIKAELQDMLSARFAELDTKLSRLGTVEQVAAAPAVEAAPTETGEEEKLIAAEIVEEDEDIDEETRVSDEDYEEDEEEDESLEFLSEDDILDVDRLRGIFQSALDEGIGDSPKGREGDDTTADLLFLEDDDLFEDEHEPEVTFSLDTKEPDNNPKARKH